MWILLIVVCAFVWGAFAAPPALADQYYDRGLQLFQAEKYPEAQLMFEYRLRVAPKDTNAQFCRAVCLDKQARVGEACEILRSLRKEYPGTDIAKRSADKLVSILGDTFKEELRREQADKSESQHAASQSSHSEHAASSVVGTPRSEGEDSGGVYVPQNARAYYTGHERDEDKIMVDVSLNGHRMKMMFDTGAFGILVYKHQVDALGIRLPDKAPEEWSSGIGGQVRSVVVPMTVELAGIKKTVEVHVTDGDGTPLLGQGFLSDLEYEIDHKGHCIHFRKSRPYDPGSKQDMYCVPFRMNGRHLVVDVEYMGGKKTPMLVDTGASSILLSAKNFYDFGLVGIPDDAIPVAHSGVGEGTRNGYAFHIEQLKLGPIILRSPEIHVLWSAANQRPLNPLGSMGLLGQPFFGNWRYTVDMKNKVLRFFH